MHGTAQARAPRRLFFLLALAAALALAVGAAACGGDDGEEAAPPAATATETAAVDTATAPTATAEETTPAECPFEGGVIRAFRAYDLAPVSGEEIGPAGARAEEVWVDKLNGEGGILGCELVIDVKDEAFPDISACLRVYRDAIASQEYDFFIGPQGSGCMAALPDLTNKAGEALIAGIAADHVPFFQKFKPFNFHSSVSTFLEGRAAARFVAEQGWERVATMVPNYAYGQDALAAFKEYYRQLVPDGEIVAEQSPEFDEDNFTPFINAMMAKNPDGVFSAFFGGFVIPFWKQWKAGGHDGVPMMSGAVVLDTFKGTKSEKDIPQNAWGYTRGDWQFTTRTPVGKELFDLYVAEYGDEFPLPSDFAFQAVTAVQMAKALIEKTQSLEPEDWRQAVEAGDFSFETPYNSGPTYVNPINHMADSCAAVGRVVWNPDVPYKASYDPDSFIISCMRDVLPADEAKQLTSNPDVSEEAIQKYYDLVGGLS